MSWYVCSNYPPPLCLGFLILNHKLLSIKKNIQEKQIFPGTQQLGSTFLQGCPQAQPYLAAHWDRQLSQLWSRKSSWTSAIGRRKENPFFLGLLTCVDCGTFFVVQYVRICKPQIKFKDSKLAITLCQRFCKNDRKWLNS